VLALQRLRDALARFEGKRVAVIGDLIADEYLYGKPARISREAPVLILRFTDREVRLGGAANAAHNVRALGATALPVGLLGQDAAGDEVHALFRRAGMDTEGISREAERPTPVKTRIMAGGYQATRQQVVRLDREPEGGISGAAEARLIERLRAIGPTVDGFLVSDYGYGTVTARVYEAVLAAGRAGGVPVTVDSRYELPRFRGATAATPNEPEVEALTGDVLERLDARLLLVTRGSRGMALFEREGPVTFMPIHGSDEIADVTGAGDTVISTFTVGLAARATPGEAAWLANVAGGVVVMKRGTATVTVPELLAALASDGGRPQR
jgi:rfaE bifunctional protein kinase chain/domain